MSIAKNVISAVKITKGMANVIGRTGSKMACPTCKLSIPIYRGRYPIKCPNCDFPLKPFRAGGS